MSKLDLSTKKAPLLALAPMAGASDKAMRLLSRAYGADLLFSEMVSAKALTFSNEKTEKLLDTTGEDFPVAIQLFGSEPEIVKKGAQRAVALGAKWLDFNMGCPVPKVAGNGEGSALLKNPSLAHELAKTLVVAVDVPVSIKVRIGWSSYDKGYFLDFVKGLEAAGIALLSIHGRTREDYYTGKANWQAIKDAVEVLTVPVLANGDVDSPESAKAILDTTGAKGIMIGRGAMGCPWLFREIKHYFETGEMLKSPSLLERSELILRHAKLLIEDKGEFIAMREMRKHIGWYVKGLRHAKHLRGEACQLESFEDLERLLLKWAE